MILVDGNPLENIDLVADADQNFGVIMKDGKIYKNDLKRVMPLWYAPGNCDARVPLRPG